MRKVVFLLIGLASLLTFGALTGSAADETYGVRNCSTGPGHLYGGGGVGRSERRLHRSRRAVAAVLLGHAGCRELEHVRPHAAERSDASSRTRSGTAGTWNFQLRPAFWLGMAMCDTQSDPEFTHDDLHARQRHEHLRRRRTRPRRTTSASTRERRSWRCSSIRRAGSRGRPASAATRRKWCAALNIDSLNQDRTPDVRTTTTASNRVGIEPVNFAFITKSGVPHAPPDPLTVFSPPFAALTPNPSTDLFMGSGDTLTVDMHDTPAGFQVVIHDLTTGQSGSMTASVANGFQQVLVRAHVARPATRRRTRSTRCTHLERAHPRAVGRAQLQRRVLRRDRALRVLQRCRRRRQLHVARSERPGRTGRRRRRLLQRGRLAVRADRRLPRHGQRLRRSVVRAELAGNGKEPRPGQEVPLDSGHVHGAGLQRDTNYSRVAFETDLPRIEAADFGGKLRPAHRKRLHQSASGRELLSDLHDRELDRQQQLALALCLAARRAGHQGNHEHVRRQLDRRVRPPALQLLSGAEPGHARPDEQLQERAELEPLPRLRSQRPSKGSALLGAPYLSGIAGNDEQPNV